jgi:hypothetical protein
MISLQLKSILDRFNFSIAGEILLLNGSLTFDLKSKSPETGLVYLWIEISESTSNVVYVGKAGRTLHFRCNQHKSGFKNNVTGRAHAKRIRFGIGQGCRYLIYFRKSLIGSILDENTIPMESVEEIAFIKKFRPLWNA